MPCYCPGHVGTALPLPWPCPGPWLARPWLAPTLIALPWYCQSLLRVYALTSLTVHLFSSTATVEESLISISYLPFTVHVVTQLEVVAPAVFQNGMLSFIRSSFCCWLVPLFVSQTICIPVHPRRVVWHRTPQSYNAHSMAAFKASWNLLTAGGCALGFCLRLAGGAHRPLAGHVCSSAQAVSRHAAQPGLPQ